MEEFKCKCDSLAISSIPYQKWETIYTPESALNIGTIFPSLNKPFFKADTSEGGYNLIGADYVQNLGNQMNQLTKEQLLCKINEISFVVNDLTLYLDTHGEDQEALACFGSAIKLRKQLMGRFATEFYPLTQSCMVELYDTKTISNFEWTNGPAPWEGEANYVAL